MSRLTRTPRPVRPADRPQTPIQRACAHTFEFGKHKGSTIARVGSTDDGIRYLDWLAGQGLDRYPETKAHLRVYLDDPQVRAIVDRVTGADVDD